MKKDLNLFLAFVLAAAFTALNGCTFVKTTNAVLLDFHPTGDAVQVHVRKPDGTEVDIAREQESAEGIVETAADVLTP